MTDDAGEPSTECDNVTRPTRRDGGGADPCCRDGDGAGADPCCRDGDGAGADSFGGRCDAADLDSGVDAESVERDTAQSSIDHSSGDVVSITLSVPSMDCPSCGSTVAARVASVPGVLEVDPHPTTGSVTVEYDEGTTAPDDVVDVVERAGYDVVHTDVERAREGPAAVWRSRRAVETGVGAALLAVGVVLSVVGLLPDPIVATLWRTFAVSDVLLLLAIAVAGRLILRNGVRSARVRSLDIDLLMSVAIVGATGLTIAFPDENLFVEAATLAVLFSLAELLERHSVNRARRSLSELFSLAPETARVRRGGEVVTVPVDGVGIGETVVVPPGEKLPLDGVVSGGASAVDQSPITGESVPVDKRQGDEVYAGTINRQGYLEVETTTAADDSTISQIIELVETAARSRTSHEQFVDRFSRYYTPAVTVGAILTATVPPLVFGWPWVDWFVRGIALLVVACPCAFVISTPVSVVSGITSAARNGVVITGGDRLEAMGEVGAVAFDKTGTLTTGELAVTDVVALNGNAEADVLRCARGLELRSEHPIGEAIVAHVDEADVPDRDVDAFESLTGRGVRADLDGTTHYAGNPSLFEELGFDLDHVHVTDGGTVPADVHAQCARQHCLDLLEGTIPRLQAEGKTVVLVGTEEHLEGLIAIADQVRPEAAAVVDRLQALGLHVAMLTGDNERTARAIAEAVGIDDVRAALLPDEKVDAVADLDREHDGVAMVGDGINDAPALATATVGVAMGAAGSDAAIDAADVALLTDDLDRLPYLARLSRAANRVIRQNVFSSLFVKGLLAVGIPLGYVSLVVAVLAGDVGMTTAVTGNAMRLSRLEPEAIDGGTLVRSE